MFGKDLCSSVRFALLENNKVATAAAHTGTEADFLLCNGSAGWLTGIVAIDKGTTGITGLSFFTYNVSGTVYNAALDLAIVQNGDDNIPVSIASGVVAAVVSDGVYTFCLPNCQRFVNVHWTGTETDTVLTIVVAGPRIIDGRPGAY